MTAAMPQFMIPANTDHPEASPSACRWSIKRRQKKGAHHREHDGTEFWLNCEKCTRNDEQGACDK